MIYIFSIYTMLFSFNNTNFHTYYICDEIEPAEYTSCRIELAKEFNLDFKKVTECDFVELEQKNASVSSKLSEIHGEKWDSFFERVDDCYFEKIKSDN